MIVKLDHFPSNTGWTCQKQIDITTQRINKMPIFGEKPNYACFWGTTNPPEKNQNPWEKTPMFQWFHYYSSILKAQAITFGRCLSPWKFIAKRQWFKCDTYITILACLENTYNLQELVQHYWWPLREYDSWTNRSVFTTYSFSHNCVSGKWWYLKGNGPIGDTPIFHWTMIMERSVEIPNNHLKWC